jgi:hypothetical protein
VTLGDFLVLAMSKEHRDAVVPQGALRRAFAPGRQEFRFGECALPRSGWPPPSSSTASHTCVSDLTRALLSGVRGVIRLKRIYNF